MKKLTIIVAIFFSANCYSQKPDSAYAINDSTIVLSKDLIETARANLMKRIESLEASTNAAKYNGWIEGINAAYAELQNLAVQEYYRKKKPVK